MIYTSINTMRHLYMNSVTEIVYASINASKCQICFPAALSPAKRPGLRVRVRQTERQCTLLDGERTAFRSEVILKKCSQRGNLLHVGNTLKFQLTSIVLFDTGPESDSFCIYYAGVKQRHGDQHTSLLQYKPIMAVLSIHCRRSRRPENQTGICYMAGNFIHVGVAQGIPRRTNRWPSVRKRTLSTDVTLPYGEYIANLSA